MLFSLVSHLKSDYQEFVAKTLKELNDVRTMPARKKSDNNISSFGRSAIRNTTMDHRKNRLNRPISEEDEKEFHRSQSNNVDSLQYDSFRDSSSPSVLNNNESYDNKPYSFSIIDDVPPLNLEAINSQMNPYTFTALAELEKAQSEKILQNSPSKRISLRTKDALTPSDCSSPRIEMANTMKKTVMESKKIFQAKRVFENLLVIGTTRKEAIENLKLPL